MRGDFSRDTFDSRKHYSSVLLQQGRVLLDADLNEQSSILLHYLRTLVRDLIGPHGGPADELGFTLSEADNGDLLIGAGRYYVDGILIENEDDVAYLSQPDYPVPCEDALRHEIDSKQRRRGNDNSAACPEFFVYLDVWERHITPIEDDYIREKSLGGPHTCTRAKVLWQVRALVAEGVEEAICKMTDLHKERGKLSDPKEIEKIDREFAEHSDELATTCNSLLDKLVASGGGLLAARMNGERIYEDLREAAPDAKYRGLENRLYRVEIHRGGKTADPTCGATFKWSRNNGSVATAWLGTVGCDLQVATTQGFSEGTWIELSDDRLELRGEPGVLTKLVDVGSDRLSVDPDGTDLSGLAWSEELINPKVRCWSQTGTSGVELSEGAIPVSETLLNAHTGEEAWFDLEDGIQVRFTADDDYRTGDYWLIPARVATGDIEWPGGGEPTPLPPRGIKHHRAPIGFVAWRGGEFEFTNCRRVFDALATREPSKR